QRDCKLRIGMTYDEFVNNCVAVTNDSVKDQVEINKLLGGLTHGTERFHFDIVGIDVNFTDAQLSDDDVVRDNDRPTGDDVSTRFDFDQSAIGRVLNDYPNNDPSETVSDCHGSGLVYLEYARLVEQALQDYRTDICDPKTDKSVT